MRKQLNYRTLCILVLALMCSFITFNAQATHFRFGHFSWEHRPDIDPFAVDFRLEVAYRRSFFGNPSIGDTFKPRGFHFGDGSTVSFDFEVIAFNEQEDWIVGRATTSGSEPGVLRHIYPSALASNGQPWTAFIDDLARIDTLINSGGGWFRVATTIDLSEGNSSPLSSLAPIVTCPRGACRFLVPAIDPDGDTLQFRLATSAESRIRSLPAGLTIDSDSGFLDWSDSSAEPLGLYSIQVIIEDLNNNGDSKSQVAMDFVINLQEFNNNLPPVFNVPPTPENNQTITAVVGQTLSFQVVASDPDAGDVVTIGHVGLPLGAEFVIASQVNPESATFTWVPNMDDLGEHLVTFTANDNKGSAALPHGLRIEVIEPGISDVRVIDRVSTEGIDIDASSFSQIPHRVEALNGYSEIEWRFKTLAVDQIENLSVDLVLTNLSPGETRQVTHQVSLSYLDVNGGPVQQSLGEQSVEVATSLFAMSLMTDKPVYFANQSVLITTQLENLSHFENTSEVALSVVDDNGVLVQDLGRHPSKLLAAQSGSALTGIDFNTQTTSIGGYQIQAQLFDEQGVLQLSASSDFTIVTASGGDINISSGIHTDKPQYQAWDQVVLNGRVSNIAVNSQMAGGSAVIEVRDINGAVLLDETRQIGSMVPGAINDYPFYLTLNDQLAGLYSVIWTVYSLDGELLSNSSSSFTVERQNTQAYGGDVSVEYSIVYQNDLNSCSYDINNRSAMASNDLAVRYQLLDMATSSVVTEQTENINIVGNGNLSHNMSIDSGLLAFGGYACVLSAYIDAQWVNLGAVGFDVRPQPIRVNALLGHGTQGRLLLLTDEARECSALEDIHVQVNWGSQFSHTDQVEVIVYNEQGELIDIESVVEWSIDTNHQHLSNGADLSIAVEILGEINVNLQAPTHKLGDSYRIEVKHKAGFFFNSSKTWQVATDCDRPFTIGEVVEDVHLLGFKLFSDSADSVKDLDPYGPSEAPLVNEQNEFIREVLDAQGWTYTVVHSASDFTYEMRHGDYAAYVVLSERIHLPVLSQKELREHVYSGTGLLVAGGHDRRNLFIESALGVSIRGKLPFTSGLQNLDTVVLSDFPYDDDVQSIRSRSATIELEYVLPAKNGKHNKNHSKSAAQTYNEYGEGKSIFMGFDALAIATEQGVSGEVTELLIASITRIVMPLKEPVAGREWPVKVTVSNLGTPVTGLASVILPQGAEMAEAKDFTKQVNIWSKELNLAKGEQLEQTLYVRMPEVEGVHTIHLKIDVVSEFETQAHVAANLELGVSAPHTIVALLDKARDLKYEHFFEPHLHVLYADLFFAQEAIENKHWWAAQVLLVGATNMLIGDEREEVVAMRLAIDEQIHIVGQKL
jgi:hypothetical protein